MASADSVRTMLVPDPQEVASIWCNILAAKPKNARNTLINDH
jgi:hypothetical protein